MSQSKNDSVKQQCVWEEELPSKEDDDRYALESLEKRSPDTNSDADQPEPFLPCESHDDVQINPDRASLDAILDAIDNGSVPLDSNSQEKLQGSPSDSKTLTPFDTPINSGPDSAPNSGPGTAKTTPGLVAQEPTLFDSLYSALVSVAKDVCDEVVTASKGRKGPPVTEPNTANNTPVKTKVMTDADVAEAIKPPPESLLESPLSIKSVPVGPQHGPLNEPGMLPTNRSTLEYEVQFANDDDGASAMDTDGVSKNRTKRPRSKSDTKADTKSDTKSYTDKQNSEREERLKKRSKKREE